MNNLYELQSFLKEKFIETTNNHIAISMGISMAIVKLKEIIDREHTKSLTEAGY